jgi:hypothetical protein
MLFKRCLCSTTPHHRHKRNGSAPSEWKMVKRPIRADFSGWSDAFDSPFSPPTLTRSDGMIHVMVSKIAVLVSPCRDDERRSSPRHFVVGEANRTMTKSRHVGVCASSSVCSSYGTVGHLLSPLLFRSSRRRILMCVVCVRHVLTSHCF